MRVRSLMRRGHLDLSALLLDRLLTRTQRAGVLRLHHTYEAAIPMQCDAMPPARGGRASERVVIIARGGRPAEI